MGALTDAERRHRASVTSVRYLAAGAGNLSWQQRPDAPPACRPPAGLSAQEERMWLSMFEQNDRGRARSGLDDAHDRARRGAEVCRRCPVIAECLAYALDPRHRVSGVWGGRYFGADIHRVGADGRRVPTTPGISRARRDARAALAASATPKPAPSTTDRPVWRPNAPGWPPMPDARAAAPAAGRAPVPMSGRAAAPNAAPVGSARPRRRMVLMPPGPETPPGLAAAARRRARVRALADGLPVPEWAEPRRRSPAATLEERRARAREATRRYRSTKARADRAG